MENLTDKELDQLRTLIVFHIGYTSETISNLKTEIKNAQNKAKESKDGYLDQLKEIYNKRLKDLDDYKNIYSKISNIEKESINNEM